MYWYYYIYALLTVIESSLLFHHGNKFWIGRRNKENLLSSMFRKKLHLPLALKVSCIRLLGQKKKKQLTLPIHFIIEYLFKLFGNMNKYEKTNTMSPK